jgi:hypothetical protein
LRIDAFAILAIRRQPSAAEQDADVVNLSLGGPPFPDDPLVEAVEQLTAGLACCS